jgi:16S rRNA processing protein RimM
MLPKLHTLGRVAGKHGYQGELVLYFPNQKFAKKIHKGDFLFIKIDGKGVPFLIERFNPKNCIVKLADVDTDAMATELEGLDIQSDIQPDIAVSIKQGAEMLKDFEVLNEEYQKIGIVNEILDYPAGPMLQLATATGNLLIPFVEDWIIELNVAERIIQIELPEGLIDL